MEAMAISGISVIEELDDCNVGTVPAQYLWNELRTMKFLALALQQRTFGQILSPGDWHNVVLSEAIAPAGETREVKLHQAVDVCRRGIRGEFGPARNADGASAGPAYSVVGMNHQLRVHQAAEVTAKPRNTRRGCNKGIFGAKRSGPVYGMAVSLNPNVESFAPDHSVAHANGSENPCGVTPKTHISSQQVKLDALKGTFVIGELKTPAKIVVELDEYIALSDVTRHEFVEGYLKGALAFIARFARLEICTPTL